MINLIYINDPEKSPNETLDYKIDFKNKTNTGSTENEDILVTGETISSFTLNVAKGIYLHDGFTVYDGIIKPEPRLADGSTSVVFWLAGGLHYKNYLITTEIITTPDIRKIVRSRILKVRQR